MIDGLLGIVMLAQNNLTQPTFSKINQQPPVQYNCGTIEEIFANIPNIPLNNRVKVTDYLRGHYTFRIEFYKANGKSQHDEDFDAFKIYEIVEGKSMKWPTASGYFKEGLMLGVVDLFTREGGKLVAPVPDGYVENAFCAVVQGASKTFLVHDVANVIAQERKRRDRR